jgi:hypothetical protein
MRSSCGGWIPVDEAVGDCEFQSEQDEVLLGTIVQVTLAASALRVGRRDDPLAGGA